MTRGNTVKVMGGGRRVLLCVGALLLAGLMSQRGYSQALPTGTGPGSYLIVGGTYSGFESDYGQQKIMGAGAYIDTNLTWRMGIEAEARRVAYPHFGERQSTLLAGPRWSFRAKGFVPYVKVLVGGGKFDFPYGLGYGDYFVVAPGAGVDLRVGQRIRLRLVDFEYQEWPGFTYGAIHPYGISAGISFQVMGSERTKLSRY